MSNDNYHEEKTSIWTIIIALVLVVGIVLFIRSVIGNAKQAPERNEEYLTQIRQDMLKDFDPSGITLSGYCIVSFEINEEGWINKRQFVKKSPVEELNRKVMDMLKSTTIVEKPPVAYTNKPIKIEFGCTADEMEASCYTKNIVD